MSETAQAMRKEDLPKKLWETATTLSDEAQSAAIRKAQELGFDINKGKIPLEETLTNLTQNRDLLLDFVDQAKFPQLPLSVQYALIGQVEKVSQSLTALVNGTDAIAILVDGVESLSASVWQLGLYNLSDKVLGLQAKMNQLKSEEVLIKQVHREAQEFKSTRDTALGLLEEIEKSTASSSEALASVQDKEGQISTILSKVTETEQKASALQIQSQQHDSALAQYAANAKTTSAEVIAIGEKAKSLQSEIDGTRSELVDLREAAQQLIENTEKSNSKLVAELNERYEEFESETIKKTDEFREALEGRIQNLADETTSRVDTSISTSQQVSSDLKGEVSQLVSDTREILADSQTAHEKHLAEHFAEQVRQIQTLTSQLQANSDAAIKHNDDETKRITDELAELNGRIRESIERATGYTLFHSFQKRQLDLAKSKGFWARALAGAVLVSIGAAAYLIYMLSAAPQYGPAFYLKLSISIPLVYAIAFCSVQYSRERRLEEEYAFKSAISISLEPYQKLVAQLVDKGQPEEISKYTAFIIESVNRVFTSPTGHVFEDDNKATSSPQLIKALGEFTEPLIKALKK